jgi:hypothetical protein
LSRGGAARVKLATVGEMRNSKFETRNS